MIKSMTGFGQAEHKTAHGRIRVELKATNHKFFEISVRLPGHLAEFEDTLRKKVAEEVRRGKVFLFVSSPDPSVFSSRLILNEPLAREVHQKIIRLQKILKINMIGPEALLRQVLQAPDVLTKDPSPNGRGSYAGDLMKAVQAAIVNLNGSKVFEGRALERDFKKRLGEIKKSLSAIEKRIPAGAREYRRSLEHRMKDFLKDNELDHERLTLEVALFVKNSDISEEVTRLKSHCHAMQMALREKGEIGRKIDFIAQEMIREVNTMGSKSSDVAIANAVIELKSAIEKIREQAQNAE